MGESDSDAVNKNKIWCLKEFADLFLLCKGELSFSERPMAGVFDYSFQF